MAKAQAQEPSMEEILASIRRIIADEEAAPKGKTPPLPEPEPAADETISEDDLDKLFASAGSDDTAPADDEDEDVLDLTDDLAVDDPPLVEGIDEAPDIAFADEFDMLGAEEDPLPEPEPEPAPPPPPPPPVTAAPPPPPPEPKPVAHAPPPVAESAPLISISTEGLVANAFSDLGLAVLNRNARTLEDLVQDMLRPMLKSWLDQNLPTMVERMVRAEIERVTRGR